MRPDHHFEAPFEEPRVALVATKKDERIIKYNEMYDPENQRLPIVTPRRIPVHPIVYDSRIYTGDFCGKVLQQLETSIDWDLRNLRNKFGISLEFRGVSNFEAEVYPDERRVEFGYDGVRVTLAPGGELARLLRERSQLPPSFPYERAQGFSIIPSGLQVPSWYAETPEVEDAMRDSTMRLTFRNAAILFNNLGVIELSKN